MPFDFKKVYKDLYQPKTKPEIRLVPPANFIACRGSGDPNHEGGAYKGAVAVLYAMAYTLKMSYLGPHKIDGYYPYVVPPLEGFWWQEGAVGIDYSDKSAFHWLAVIRLPDFIEKSDFDWATAEASKKKKLDCSAAEFLTIDEGLCAQMLHLGAYDDEQASLAKMDAFCRQNGYEPDFSHKRRHHEIYLSDPRKTESARLKTVLRHPVRPVK